MNIFDFFYFLIKYCKNFNIFDLFKFLVKSPKNFKNV